MNFFTLNINLKLKDNINQFKIYYFIYKNNLRI